MNRVEGKPHQSFRDKEMTRTLRRNRDEGDYLNTTPQGVIPSAEPLADRRS